MDRFEFGKDSYDRLNRDITDYSLDGIWDTLVHLVHFANTFCYYNRCLFYTTLLI